MSVRMLTRFTIAVAVATLTLAAANPACAAQARPWLCRDKPVFSSDHPMNYSISARAGVQWQLFFMQYEQNAAHDGFEITDSKEIGPRGATQTGKLSPGRYFTVAMSHQHGVWICHKYSRVQPNPKGVANICYGRTDPTCLVTLDVKNNMSIATPVEPIPMP